MVAGAVITMAVALAAIVWTTAYAWTDTIPSLLWLHRARAEDAWLDSIVEMHETLDRWVLADNMMQFGVVTVTL
jgi:hypothetical protein